MAINIRARFPIYVDLNSLHSDMLFALSDRSLSNDRSSRTKSRKAKISFHSMKEHLALTPSRSNAEAFHRISRTSSAAIIHCPLGQRRNPATLRTAQQQGTQKGTQLVPDDSTAPSLGSSTRWAPGSLVIPYRGVGEAFQDQIEAINAAQARLTALEQQLRDIVPTWTMAPVAAAYQALRGVSFLVAATFVAEVGDIRRFTTPQQLMAFLGLVPSERTTGDTVRRGSITKTGNRRARRVLVEGAWTYRHPARVSQTLQSRINGLPLTVRTIAWKAQVRLCARYRRLVANGKNPAVAATAVAREMAAFLWAIGHQVAPNAP